MTASRVLRGVAWMARRAYERLVHPLRRRAAVRRLGRRPPPRSVLVVCHGNICRSPYAAALLRRRLPSLVRVRSAGFIGPGRSCPEVAVRVATARGLDLSAHRSQLLTPPEVLAADLILVMDTTQHWAIRALFGRNSDDVLVLGDLDPEPIEARQIRDPVEQPREVFELSYARIERCVGELVRVLSLNAQGVPERNGRQEQTA